MISQRLRPKFQLPNNFNIKLGGQHGQVLVRSDSGYFIEDYFNQRLNQPIPKGQLQANFTLDSQQIEEIMPSSISQRLLTGKLTTKRLLPFWTHQ